MLTYLLIAPLTLQQAPLGLQPLAPTPTGLVELQDDRAFLGVQMSEASGELLIDAVTLESAAAAAGLQSGDRIVRVGGVAVESGQEVAEQVRARRPGDELEVKVLRDGKEIVVTARLGKAGGGAISAPLTPVLPGELAPTAPRTRGMAAQDDDTAEIVPASEGAYLGVSLTDDDAEGILVTQVLAAAPAAEAGLVDGDRIVEFDGHAIGKYGDLVERLERQKPGDSVSVGVVRDGDELDLMVILGARPQPLGITGGAPGAPGAIGRVMGRPGIPLPGQGSGGKNRIFYLDGEKLPEGFRGQFNFDGDLEDLLDGLRSGTQALPFSMDDMEGLQFHFESMSDDWEAWADDVSAQAERWGEAFSEQMEGWAQDFEPWAESFAEDMEDWAEHFEEGFEGWAEDLEDWGEQFGEEFGEDFEAKFRGLFDGQGGLHFLHDSDEDFEHEFEHGHEGHSIERHVTKDDDEGFKIEIEVDDDGQRTERFWRGVLEDGEWRWTESDENDAGAIERMRADVEREHAHSAREAERAMQHAERAREQADRAREQAEQIRERALRDADRLRRDAERQVQRQGRELEEVESSTQGVDAVLERLEALERELDALRRENAELRDRVGDK